jgi:hypothetical protein
MPPQGSGDAAQLELAECEPVAVGPIMAGLVHYWTGRADQAEKGGSRDSYVEAKRAGERLLVSMGWRFLPVNARLDPAQLPHPSDSLDCGRFAAYPHELRIGDTLILPSFSGRPGYVWRTGVIGTTHRRRKKRGGYNVEVTSGVLLQFEEDDALVIDRGER